MLKMEPED